MNRVLSFKFGLWFILPVLVLISLSCKIMGTSFKEEAEDPLTVELTPTLRAVVPTDLSEETLPPEKNNTLESGIIWESSINVRIALSAASFKFITSNDDDFILLDFPRSSYEIDNLFVIFSDGEFRLFKRILNTGELVWESPIEGYILGKGNSTVFVLGKDNRLIGIDAETGAEKWKIILNSLIPEEGLTPMTQIISQGENYVQPFLWKNACGYFIFNEETGEVLLNERLELQCEMHMVMDGVLFIGSRYEPWMGINISDGSELWKWGDQENLQLYELNPDLRVFYTLFNNTTDMFARNPINGSDPWGAGLYEKNNLEVDRYPRWFKNGVTDEFIVTYVNTQGNKNFGVFDRELGNLLTLIPEQRSVETILARNKVLVVSYPELKTSRGIDLVTSNVLWEKDDWSFPDPENYVSIGDNIIFFDSPNLYALDTMTGNISWENSNLSIPLSRYYGVTEIYENEVLLIEKDKAGDKYRITLIDPLSGEIVSHSNYLFNYPVVIQPITEDLWLVVENSSNSYLGTGKLMLVNMFD